jgi:hypothetical protein
MNEQQQKNLIMRGADKGANKALDNLLLCLSVFLNATIWGRGALNPWREPK